MEGSQPSSPTHREVSSPDVEMAEEWTVVNDSVLPVSIEKDTHEGGQWMVVFWLTPDNRLGSVGLIWTFRNEAPAECPDWPRIMFDPARTESNRALIKTLKQTDNRNFFWQYLIHMQQGIKEKIPLDCILDTFMPREVNDLSDVYRENDDPLGGEFRYPESMKQVLKYWTARLGEKPENVTMFEA